MNQVNTTVLYVSLLSVVGKVFEKLLNKRQKCEKKCGLYSDLWYGFRSSSCYLEMLNRLQKRICRTVGPSLAASLEPLAHRRNEASLSFL